MPRLTFESWLARVDAIITNTVGIGMDDLQDMCYRDMYDDGYSPKEAAKETLEEAGWS